MNAAPNLGSSPDSATRNNPFRRTSLAIVAFVGMFVMASGGCGRSGRCSPPDEELRRFWLKNSVAMYDLVHAAGTLPGLEVVDLEGGITPRSLNEVPAPSLRRVQDMMKAMRLRHMNLKGNSVFVQYCAAGFLSAGDEVGFAYLESEPSTGRMVTSLESSPAERDAYHYMRLDEKWYAYHHAW